MIIDHTKVVIADTFPGLQALLANDKIIKVGHGCSSDFACIQRDRIAPVIQNTVDTLPIAIKLGCQKPNLRVLGMVWQHLKICKAMQISDWEAVTLSDEQIRYAATDAWMARQGNHSKPFVNSNQTPI
jgi:ribonuclease D